MIPFFVVAQIFIVQAPPPPPQAEAIRILLANPGLSNVATWPPPRLADASRVTISHSEPGSMSWMAWPKQPEERRLDGSKFSDPPTISGNPYPLAPTQAGNPSLRPIRKRRK